MAFEWANLYDKDFASLMEKYKDYTTSIFNIEREQKKPRKDIAYFSEVKDQIWYMYDELFNPSVYEWQKVTGRSEIKNILDTYLNDYYKEDDDKDSWFNHMKEAAVKLGYAGEMREYKDNPDNYKGSIADFSTVVRVALTSKCNTPDLYEIMRLLGKDRIMSRINKVTM